MRFLLYFGLAMICLAAQGNTDGGVALFQIDSEKTGQIVQWQVGERPIIHNEEPVSPLVLRYDGVEHPFVPKGVSEQAGVIHVKGMAGENEVVISYKVDEGYHKLEIDIQIERSAANLEGFTWRLPLSLDFRKRVWFRGDYGMEWDMRYFYQFNVGSQSVLLTEPERNEWRWFALDRFGESGFRLWKAESERTSPLIIQEGAVAAPAVQVYDRNQGVMLELEEVDASMPLRLQVDAAGGAELIVEALPAILRPTSENSELLLEQPFRVVLYAMPDDSTRKTLREAVARHLASSDRPSPASVMQESSWLRDAPLHKEIRYVTGGYPFARGVLTKDRFVSIDDKPLQVRPLAYWPDLSVKHALLTFPLPEPQGEEQNPEPLRPLVSLRDGSRRQVELEVSDEPRPSAPAPAILLVSQDEKGRVKIENDEMTVELTKGRQWLVSLKWEGKELLENHEESRLVYSDFVIEPDRVGFFERGVQEVNDRGVLEITELEVEEHGPLRAVVRVGGMTTNREPVRMSLRLEFHAGSSEIRMSHTAIFRFKDPRKTFLSGMGIELPLAGEIGENVTFAEEQPVFNPEWRWLSLLQLTPFFQCIEEMNGEGEWVNPRDAHAPGWIQFSGQVPMVAAIRYFREMAPKAITLDRSGQRLRFELWPEEAGLMDVRRYSDYPHLAQGESVHSRIDWVETDYYPKDPFVGVSRTHEILLSLDTVAGKAASVAADFQSPPLLYAGWEQYQDAGVALPAGDAREWPGAWSNWTKLANFWLWHRELYGWYGFWNFGDVRHHFQNGYGWIAPSSVVLRDRPWERNDRKAKKLDRGDFVKDYFPDNDWPYDNGRWGWSNTEGLPGMFLQYEYMRTGNRVVYFAAEAMARHTRDVVTRHEGLWYGQGTRHGVQHWSDGHHCERQTVVTEYRHHYYLSGEARSQEVVENLYRDIYLTKPAFIHTFHSARLMGLLFHWEMTGDAGEAERLQSYVDAFLDPEGIYISPNVRFPAAAAHGTARHLNDGTMFFHTFGGMHALVEYYQLTGYEPLRVALVKMADKFLENPAVRERIREGRIDTRNVFWPVVAFALKHGDEPEKYHEALQQYVKNGAWQSLYQTVTENPAHWSGPSALLRNNVALSFFWNNWAPYITSALEEEIWSEPMLRIFEQAEAEGKGSRQVPGTTSWQHQFDDLEGDNEYFSRQFPFGKKDSLIQSPTHTPDP